MPDAAALTLARRLLDAEQTATLLLTSAGIVVHANPEAGTLLGQPAEDVVGAALPALTGDPRAASDALALWRSSGAPRPAPLTVDTGGDTTRLRGDGARVDEDLVLVRVRPSADANTAMTQLRLQVEADNLRALRDRLRTALVALEDANQHLERRNEELQQYASAVAHDLRNPLHIASGYASLLREDHGDALGEDGLALLDQVLAATDRMAEVTDALLALARLEIAPPTEATDTTTVVRDVQATMQPELEARHATLTVSPLPPLHLQAAHLHAIVTNLVDNALKFHRGPGGPRIEVTAANEAGVAGFHVDDDGPGVPDEDRHRIFVAFDRGSAHPDRPGTGIGLATCHKVVTSHGGDIRCEPSPLGGARFTILLPVGPGDDSARAGAQKDAT